MIQVIKIDAKCDFVFNRCVFYGASQVDIRKKDLEAINCLTVNALMTPIKAL